MLFWDLVRVYNEIMDLIGSFDLHPKMGWKNVGIVWRTRELGMESTSASLTTGLML